MTDVKGMYVIEQYSSYMYVYYKFCLKEIPIQGGNKVRQKH